MLTHPTASRAGAELIRIARRRQHLLLAKTASLVILAPAIAGGYLGAIGLLVWGVSTLDEHLNKSLWLVVSSAILYGTARLMSKAAHRLMDSLHIQQTHG